MASVAPFGSESTISMSSNKNIDPRIINNENNNEEIWEVNLANTYKHKNNMRRLLGVNKATRNLNRAKEQGISINSSDALKAAKKVLENEEIHAMTFFNKKRRSTRRRRITRRRRSP
jgi:hypothetical protein